MHLLALFASTATGLPWKHRAGEPRVMGSAARLRQPTIPVVEQRPADTGLPKIQDGRNEQCIPKHMTAVRLTVQSTRGHADIQVG